MRLMPSPARQEKARRALLPMSVAGSRDRWSERSEGVPDRERIALKSPMRMPATDVRR
jgi:hypothetical protein